MLESVGSIFLAIVAMGSNGPRSRQTAAGRSATFGEFVNFNSSLGRNVFGRRPFCLPSSQLDILSSQRFEPQTIDAHQSVLTRCKCDTPMTHWPKDHQRQQISPAQNFLINNTT